MRGCMVVVCIALLWTTGAGALHAQESSAEADSAQTDTVVVRMGWEGPPPFGRCCIRPSAWGGPLSFYPITMYSYKSVKRHSSDTHNTERDLRRAEKRNAKREEVRCRCIEKAIAEYARTWVDLQSGDITPEKAKSKLTLHLTCAPCDRWEDLENLLNFIDAELAQHRAEKR
jgi:hypothetical protein